MEKRATERIAVDLRTDLYIRGQAHDAVVYDLSQGGCMLECADAFLRKGDELALVLMGQQHCGCVVWLRDACLGVRFSRELAAVVVSALGFKPADRDFNDILPRDRFGRLLPSLPAKQPRGPGK